LLLIVEFRNIAFGDFSHPHTPFITLFLVMPFFCSCVFFVFGVQLLSSKKLVLPSLLLTCVVYGVGLSFIGGRCSHRSGSRFSLGGVMWWWA